MKGMLIKRIGVAVIAAATALSMLGGCKQLETKTPENTVAATFGSEKIMLNELNYYIHSKEYDWEKSNDSSDLMNGTLGSGLTVGDYLKSVVLTEMHQALVLGEYAGKNNISLSDAQLEKVNAAVDQAMENNAEKYEAIGADRAMVLKEYTANALANDVYLELVKDVDTSVGADEFIRKEVTFVKLTPSEITAAPTTAAPTTEEFAEEESAEEGEPKTAEAESEAPAPETTEAAAAETEEEAGTDEAAEETTLSAEEIARNEAMAEAAAEIEESFKDGEKPVDVIGAYVNNSNYSATYSTKTISENGSDAYNEAAWGLAEGETTIFTAEDGSMYILLCLNDNDEAARQTAIDQEIENRRKALFTEKYEQIQGASSKFAVDQAVLASILFTAPAYVAPTEATTGAAEAVTEEAGSEEEAATQEAEAETEAAEAETQAAEAETEAAPEGSDSEEAESETAAE